MKKEIIFLIALTFCFAAFSQNHQQSMELNISNEMPKNELKMNLTSTIFGMHPEIFYERILREDISIGSSLGISLRKDSYFYDFGFIPYVRWFLWGTPTKHHRYGAGFFIEVNAAVISTEIQRYEQSNTLESQVGAGLSLGWKYLSRNNWVGEFNLGVGRLFTNDEAYPRLGITLGKRF